jgi:transcriptional antiterminator RfaH
VRFGAEPVADPETDNARIRERIDADDGLVRLTAPELEPGQRVRVTEGPLFGWEAVFLAKEGFDRVRLLLQILGTAREVVLPRQQLGLSV